MFTHLLFCLLCCLPLFSLCLSLLPPLLNYPSVIHPPPFFFFVCFILFVLLFLDVASLTASVHAPSGPVPAQTQFPWQQIQPQLQVIYPYYLSTQPPTHPPQSKIKTKIIFCSLFKPLVFHCLLHVPTTCCKVVPVSWSVTCRSWFDGL